MFPFGKKKVYKDFVILLFISLVDMRSNAIWFVRLPVDSKDAIAAIHLILCKRTLEDILFTVTLTLSAGRFLFTYTQCYVYR